MFLQPLGCIWKVVCCPDRGTYLNDEYFVVGIYETLQIITNLLRRLTCLYQVDCLQRLHTICKSLHVVVHGLVVPSGRYQVVGDEKRVHGIACYPF